MVDDCCRALPHRPLCPQSGLQSLGPASESRCFCHLSREPFAPAYRFLIDASVKRPRVGHSLGQ